MRKLLMMVLAAVATLGVAQNENLYNAHAFTMGFMSDFTTPYEYVDCPYALPENARTQTCLVIDDTPMFMRLAVDVTMSSFNDVWPVTNWMDDHTLRIYNRVYAFQPAVGSLRMYGIGIQSEGDGAILWVVEYPAR